MPAYNHPPDRLRTFRVSVTFTVHAFDQAEAIKKLKRGLGCVPLGSGLTDARIDTTVTLLAEEEASQ